MPNSAAPNTLNGSSVSETWPYSKPPNGGPKLSVSSTDRRSLKLFGGVGKVGDNAAFSILNGSSVSETIGPLMRIVTSPDFQYPQRIVGL